ncbi:hypothetical protein [Amaricoccus sp.]|uniref:hypothetical protein n=1 Tax=Amaricoccus sp. TaxID=1872485 RepID=UPI001B4C8AEF|nr:hypothetical protein [Amaricoccus sp.]MBP7242516.1 hypothetical protein [Amaricoccus sp.]
MGHASRNVDQGSGRLVAALCLGVIGALAASILTLVAGHGLLLAFVAYMMAGSAISAGVLAGVLAHARVAHVRRRNRPGGGVRTA